MKAYRDTAGVFHRTQADAKASGLPFEPVDIDTSHAGLIAFLNGLGVRAPAEEEETGSDYVNRMAQRMARGPEYQNGDPTVPVMGSRDPLARFTCRSCGTVNTPTPDR